VLAQLTAPEEDYILIPYNPMIENIENYADTAIQFGFSTLFVSALPIAPFFSLVSNYVKVKVITWKLTNVSVFILVYLYCYYYIYYYYYYNYSCINALFLWALKTLAPG